MKKLTAPKARIIREMSNQSWHALEVKEVLQRLDTNEKRGLTKDEAGNRLEEFGPNVLREQKRLRLLQLVVLHTWVLEEVGLKKSLNLTNLI